MTGPVTVTTCSNIALIKYWGKRDAERNIPDVGSLSLPLGALQTVTTVDPDGRGRFELDGREMSERERERILALCRRLGVDAAHLDFCTENRFPTAAGLASSASGGAAAVVALIEAFGLQLSRDRIIAETLRVSGSAPRSLIEGFARIDPVGDGVSLRALPVPAAWDLRVLVVCTATGPKKHLSRDAMAQSRTSPYYDAWVASHPSDLDAAEQAIHDMDLASLLATMEHSTLKMHAVPVTSRPAIIYWNAVTWAVIERVRAIREREHIPAGFTMDAGPHVKVFCEARHAERIGDELRQIPGVVDLITTEIGHGPIVQRAGAAPEPWRLPA
ncbi:MAG: diphosphomevalonate decarboxylase [Candidatus Dadabacteria bacterium]|nr:MAG: diphosphomevalonate decarboxylase [Candidatus Dadabacteria bacterium]